MWTEHAAAAAALSSVGAQDWAGVLAEVEERVTRHVVRPETAATLGAVTMSLLADVGRKNCWTLAEHAACERPWGMQHALARGAWDTEAIEDELRGFVTTHLGQPGGVLIVDETGDAKKGSHTVGTQRQYSGTTGRIENCQVAVYMAYASGAGHALVDRELYLPRSWTEMPARCAAAGVPAEVGFATKPALAAGMIEKALDAGLPASWVAADEVYGANTALCRRLEARGIGYVLAIATNRRLPFDALNSATASRLAADLPQRSWQVRSAGAGAHGQREYEWAWVGLDERIAALGQRRVPARAGEPEHREHREQRQPAQLGVGGPSWSLLVRRNLKTAELAYYLCYQGCRIVA